MATSISMVIGGAFIIVGVCALLVSWLNLRMDTISIGETSTFLSVFVGGFLFVFVGLFLVFVRQIARRQI